VIPSYKRAETFRTKTLALLERYKVNPKRIHVFVANRTEQDIYMKIAPPQAKIIVGVPGMKKIRNFITDYFDEDQPLVCLDDDIDGLFRRMNEKRYVHLEQFDDMAKVGFKSCDRTQSRLWGIYPVLNAMFMKQRITRDLKYIVGCVWGCYNTKSIKVTTDDKEDFERSILFYKECGAVIRLEYIAPKTAYYSEPGGMQVTRTDKRVRDSAVYLTDKYPDLCSLNTSKKSGHWEVRLKDKR
jgi:hypothetical protein